MEFKLPQRKENSNKSTYGRVLNIAGSDYMPGAAYLSSVSALKIGCGYCFLATTDDARHAVAAQSQNIVFVKESDIKQYAKAADVVAIGCGLGQSNLSVAFFEKFVKYTPVQTPVIIDADGLNLLAKNPQNFLNKNFENIILTPHPGEAARLLNVDDVTSDINSAAKLISDNYNCITVLKTPQTFISSPDGRKTYKNNTGNSALSKAGSGDILTGMIAGLIAQGTAPFEAACLGVYLHGLCGDIASNKLNSYCVMGKDIIDAIPEAINSLLK